MRALLALEDGRIFEGESFGATGTRVGEICFNTSMTGYQEVLTDPSYRGQIVAMTYPLIGNYGTNALDQESRTPHVRGFVIEEFGEEEVAGFPRLKRVPDTSTRHQLTRFGLMSMAERSDWLQAVGKRASVYFSPLPQSRPGVAPTARSPRR